METSIHTRARRTDPSTSREAGQLAPSTYHYNKIIEALKSFGPMGVHGIALVSDLDPSQVFRRMKELEKFGVVCLTGERVPSPTRYEREWQLVEVL